MKLFFTLILLASLAVSPIYSVGAADGLNVDINIKAKFQPGDYLNYDYRLINNSVVAQTVVFTARLNCALLPERILTKQTVSLNAGQSWSGKFDDNTPVTNLTNSQTCRAIVTILEPTSQVFSTVAEVAVAAPNNLSLNVAGKANCPLTVNSFVRSVACVQALKTVYYLNDVVLLSASGLPTNAKTSAVLVLPNNSQRKITLPYVFKPTARGTYRLRVTVSQKGQADLIQETVFGAVNRKVNIPTVSVGKLNVKNNINIGR